MATIDTHIGAMEGWFQPGRGASREGRRNADCRDVERAPASWDEMATTPFSHLVEEDLEHGEIDEA